MTHAIDRLKTRADQKGPVCLGLDTQASFLPGYIQKMDMSLGEKFFLFNQAIIDATSDEVGCYKVQIACYEALGLDGMAAFAKTLQYARGKGVPVISDVKRGDISSTAAQYAAGHFAGDFQTDLITVNAYMGLDAVSPYFPYISEKGKALFLLVKTSNPGSGDFQDQKVGGQALYELVAQTVSRWGEPFVGESGYSALGAVVGLTYPREFETIKALMPKTFFLIPGYGAQGGTGKDIAGVFKGGICGVVNSSRGLICAYQGKTEGEDFAKYVHDAAKAMREDILQWL
ncbi:MAG: orotidine-5'-phosphate decarboxylase [Christensenellaceae bacterium]|jgi:orotidine-5'-phosphate decarboxylase|nr:orotidine-5'-phosphate decarboxylase [Christensenellaceae bacterium]